MGCYKEPEEELPAIVRMVYNTPFSRGGSLRNVMVLGIKLRLLF